MKRKIESETDLLSAVINTGGYQSKTAARSAMKSGRVLVNGKVEKITTKLLSAGDVVEIISVTTQKTEARKQKILEFPFPILFEDDHLLAVEKPAGLLSAPPDKKQAKNLLSIADRYIRLKSDNVQKAFPVQPLDKQASGIVLMAKTFRAQQNLLKDWQQFTKRYYALCEGKFSRKEGSIDAKLKENRIGLVYADNRSGHSVPAQTEYRLMNANEDYSLVKLTVTGEIKNQVRAHCAANNTPIAGDKKYRAETDPLRRLCLHFFSLIFTHPVTGAETEIKLQVPANFIAVIKGRKIKPEGK